MNTFKEIQSLLPDQVDITEAPCTAKKLDEMIEKYSR